jgi:hypothetical protein
VKLQRIVISTLHAQCAHHDGACLACQPLGVRASWYVLHVEIANANNGDDQYAMGMAKSEWRMCSRIVLITSEAATHCDLDIACTVCSPRWRLACQPLGVRASWYSMSCRDCQCKQWGRPMGVANTSWSEWLMCSRIVLITSEAATHYCSHGCSVVHTGMLQSVPARHASSGLE